MLQLPTHTHTLQSVVQLHSAQMSMCAQLSHVVAGGVPEYDEHTSSVSGL